MDLIGILEKTVSPDKAELEGAQNYLEQAAQNNLPEFPKSLSSVLSCATNSLEFQMAAGLQLNNTLTSKDQEYQEGRLQFPADVRSFVKQNGSNIENDSCPKTNQQFGKVLQETSTKKQKPLPLNTEQLNACRYPMKKIAVVSILWNGEVCVEWLKTVRGKQYVSRVFFISYDGKWIDAYKPHNCLVGSTPPPKPTDNTHIIDSFVYDDLPSKYWKMYRTAKFLVDSVRAVTLKIAYFDEDSLCFMMENYPNSDFKMEFFNGGNITQKSNKISITDKWGQTISVTELDRSDKHFADMWNNFCKHNSYDRINNSSNKYRLNAPSTYSFSPNSIDAIFMDLKRNPQLIKGEVYIEYKDGYTVRCSQDRELVRIYDSRKNCVYHSVYNDKTDSLIDMILQDLPFFVPLAVYLAMEPDA